ncbi:hypothetical protein [Candidatus Amarolinea dominans]|uniref:hypothetical protein n=1 Tax=Candidatus Amarolinea dominans TaxID=3140696 RepID=UPI00313658A0|nr:hypothetical protein [Anaerolineae bacterium]
MTEAAKYQVTIHGNVYDLAIGDGAQVISTGPRDRATPPFMAPPPPPQGILGRDDDLTRVFDLLQLGDTDAADVPPVALRGLGGIGKTTLAAALGRLAIMPELFPDGVAGRRRPQPPCASCWTAGARPGRGPAAGT